MTQAIEQTVGLQDPETSLMIRKCVILCARTCRSQKKKKMESGNRKWKWMRKGHLFLSEFSRVSHIYLLSFPLFTTRKNIFWDKMSSLRKEGKILN
jgi:hypothetical protein